MKRVYLLILFILFSATVSADTIYLKSGRVVQGKIIHRTPIYIRFEPKYLGDPEREFLVENVRKVVYGDADIIPAEQVYDYVAKPNFKDVPEHIQDAARKMAVSLLEQAMRDVYVPSLNDAPVKVKLVAEQKASDILAQAMESLNETPDNVKDAAREIANSLLEETVRTTDIESVNEVPDDVKKAAQDKASALIEHAMIGSVEEAPDQVKFAAQLKARDLIEDAMREINILDKVISEGQIVQKDYELSDIIQKNKQDERARLTRFDREIPKNQVDALLKEAVNQRVNTVKENEHYEIVEITESTLDDGFFEGEPSEVVKEQIELANTQVVNDTVLPVEDTESPEQNISDTFLTEEELEAKIAAIPKPQQKKLTFQDFIMVLSYRDYLVMGLCIVLLLILLSQRGKSGSPKASKKDEPDIQVVSSITFQHLPENVKSKFTSSDITFILEVEEHYYHKHARKSGEVVIELDKLLKFIQEEAKQEGHSFALDDLKKVIETKEQTLTETGLA